MGEFDLKTEFEEEKIYVIHQQWLKVMEAEAQEGNYGY